METSFADDALWSLIFMVILVLLLGYAATPLAVYCFHRSARAEGMKKVNLCIGAAYWAALFLPWCYLMARIDGARIPSGVTIALYTALYLLWIAMIGLYVYWAFNAIEYNYAFEESSRGNVGIGLRTTIAFVATITACSVTFMYSILGLISERFSSFGEGGNRIKQILVPTARDALPYALCALWIPLLFSIGNFGSTTILAIGFAAWRVFCRRSVQRRAVNAEQAATVPDWREALPFAFFGVWILMFPVMWGIFYGIGST